MTTTMGRPARRIVTGRRNRCVGTFPSRKLNALVEFESLLELDALTVVEADREVLSYWAQPVTLRWRDGTGRARRYTPDLLLRTVSGLVCREVKPAARLGRDPSLGGRLADIVARCEAVGWRFETWADSDIRREPRLANSRSVVGAGRHRTADEAAEAAVLAFATSGGTTLRMVAAATGLDVGRLGRSALRLAALDRLGLDLDLPFGPATLVHGRIGR